MKKSCTICGCSYGSIYAFKAGHVCENCVQFFKSQDFTEHQVRTNDQY